MMLCFLFVSFHTSLFAGDYDGFVVVKIENLSLDEYNSLAVVADGDNKLDVDDYCLGSGVMVFRLSGISISNEADLEMFLKNKIKVKVDGKEIKILDTHLESRSGTSKC